MNLDEYCAFDTTGLAELVRRSEIQAKELAMLAADILHVLGTVRSANGQQ